MDVAPIKRLEIDKLLRKDSTAAVQSRYCRFTFAVLMRYCRCTVKPTSGWMDGMGRRLSLSANC